MDEIQNVQAEIDRASAREKEANLAIKFASERGRITDWSFIVKGVVWLFTFFQLVLQSCTSLSEECDLMKIASQIFRSCLLLFRFSACCRILFRRRAAVRLHRPRRVASLKKTCFVRCRIV